MGDQVAMVTQVLLSGGRVYRDHTEGVFVFAATEWKAS